MGSLGYSQKWINCGQKQTIIELSFKVSQDWYHQFVAVILSLVASLYFRRPVRLSTVGSRRLAMSELWGPAVQGAGPGPEAIMLLLP